MIVTDRLVFIHLHKSGGTFVNQLLLQCVPSARQLGYHLPYRELPAEYRSLPVVGTVRNPWEYYVSWYFFQRGQARPNALYRICSDAGTLDFSGTVRNLADLASDPARLNALRSALPEGFGAAGLNLTKTCLDEFRELKLGFYTFLYERMYRGAKELTIVPVETLRSGIRTTFERLGLLPNARVDLFLQTAPRMNATQHGPYQDYFGPDLHSLIGQLDRSLIAKHEYSF